MIEAKQRASLLKRRKIACLCGVLAVIVLLIAMFLVQQLVKITPWTDADGTEYTVRAVDDIYGLYDKDKNKMPLDNGYYSTVLGTLVEIDEETGEITEIIYLENAFVAQGNEEEGANRRVQIFPHIKKADILSIDVTNEHGSYTFHRYNITTGKVDKNADFVIKGSLNTVFDEEKFAELYVDAGYALSLMKLKDPIKDENGQFSEYGLVPATRTRKATDEDGKVLTDEQGDPIMEEYAYVPAYYVITDVNGNRHKIIVGDALLTGSGYYVQYVDMSGSEEIKRDAVYVLDSSLSVSALASIEYYVTPQLTYPMGTMRYLYVEKFTVRHLDESTKGTASPVYEPIVAFSLVDISLRENTLSASFPYYFDDVTFMDEIRSMKGYYPHTDNINACLADMYQVEFAGVKKLSPTKDDMVKYGLYSVVTDSQGQPVLDADGKKQYVPASQYTLSFDHTVDDEEDDTISYTYSHDILVSEKNEDGNYYVYTVITAKVYQKAENGEVKEIERYTYSYDTISEVAGHSLSFMEWETMDWVSTSFIHYNIAFIDSITLETNDYSASFDLDNSQSPTENTSSALLQVHATDTTGRDMTTFNQLSVVDKWDYTWVISASTIEVYDANGKTASIKDGMSYYDYNVLGNQVLVKNGYIECQNGDLVEVGKNHVKVIHPGGSEDNYVRYSTNLFRLLYQTMFYAQIVNSYEVTKEEEAKLTDPSNLLAKLTITTKDRDGTVDTNVYAFYRISSRKAYITINGNGGFYVQSGRVEKFLTDTEKFFNYQTIDPLAKK